MLATAALGLGIGSAVLLAESRCGLIVEPVVSGLLLIVNPSAQGPRPRHPEDRREHRQGPRHGPDRRERGNSGFQPLLAPMGAIRWVLSSHTRAVSEKGPAAEAQ